VAVYTREHDLLTGAIHNLAVESGTLFVEDFGGNETFSAFTYKGGARI